MIWLLPKIWRGIKALARAIGRIFGRRPEPDPAAAGTSASSSSGGGGPAGIALSLPSGHDEPR
jgi:hypothetical protein